MKRLIGIVLLCLGLPAVAVAQVSAVQLSLADAISRGLDTSHRVGEQKAREQAALAVEDQRKAANFPQVTLSGGYTRINHVPEFGVPRADGGFGVIYPDIPNNARTRIELQWPIYTGGRTPALIKAAGGEAQAARLDVQTTQADLRLEITRAYWAVLTARASRDVLTEALERTSAHLTDVRNQLDVGLVPPSDVLSTEAQEARQEMLRIEAENILENASAELRRLVGLPPDTPLEMTDAIRRPPPPPGDAAQSVQTALGARTDRRSLAIRAEAAADRVTAAAAGRLPTINVAGGFDLARPNRTIFPITEGWRHSWDIGVNVRWPVFDGGRVRAETAEAQALRLAAEERQKDFDTVIDVDVRARISDLRSAEAAIDASNVGVRAAAEARRVIAERFSAGVATNTDVLDAQMTLLQAELDLTRALASAQMASARLDRALGR
jgi:outer membrane protein